MQAISFRNPQLHNRLMAINDYIFYDKNKNSNKQAGVVKL